MSTSSRTVVAPLRLRSREWGHIPGRKLGPPLCHFKAPLKFQCCCDFLGERAAAVSICVSGLSVGVAGYSDA